MNKVVITLAVTLAATLVALPLAYQFGKRTSADQQQEKYDNTLAEIKRENAQALNQITSSMNQMRMDLELRQVSFESHLRQTLLNTGVKLETLNIEPETPDEIELGAIDTVISQETYRQLKIGISYEEVIEMVGREGENTLNMMDENGSGTSAFVWRWTNDDETEERMTITFEDLKLSDKHYTALTF